MSSEDGGYDLIVVGEAAVDILLDFTPLTRRPGGVFYSALAANAIGLKVGIAGIGGALEKNEFISSIENLGIDTSGILPDPQSYVEYQISNSNEIFPQVIINRSPIAIVQAEFPIAFNDAKAVLLYPMQNLKCLVELAEEIKKKGGIVCLDLQHDAKLSSFIELIKLVDVIFASRSELLEITATKTDAEALERIWAEGTRLVVIKYGIGGSTIYRRNERRIPIPSFLANFKCTIGTGDVYNAVFISELLKSNNLENAGTIAALSASVFSENLEFEKYFNALNGLDFDREKCRRFSVFAHPEQLSSVKIYLAGSFLSMPMRNWVDLVVLALESRGFSVFSPYRDVGLLAPGSDESDKTKFFELDVLNLGDSNFVIALLDNISRGGVGWEIGYAFSKNIPVFGLITDNQTPISNMISQSCKTINSNLPNLLNDIFQHVMDDQLL